MSQRDAGSACQDGLVGFTAGVQLGQHASAQTASLPLVPLTIGIIASAFAAMGGLVARLGRTLIVLGLGIVLLSCGRGSVGSWALPADSGSPPISSR